jgi:ATP-dependent 26S proteasome regulatory subunit
MVVLEDVDLIAQGRGQPFQPTGPILFELLNKMDGLRDDCDVIFVLPTNRPDILEPALAARPGRIDLAIELPLPDADGRRRLFDLSARGLELRDADLDSLVQRSEGASPAYIKELLRHAALLAASEHSRWVEGRLIDAAMDSLNAGGELAQRILGFRRSDQMLAPAAPSPTTVMRQATGFPTVGWSTRADNSR